MLSNYKTKIIANRTITVYNHLTQPAEPQLNFILQPVVIYTHILVTKLNYLEAAQVLHIKFTARTLSLSTDYATPAAVTSIIAFSGTIFTRM